MSRGVDQIRPVDFGFSMSGFKGEGSEMTKTVHVEPTSADGIGISEWRALSGETRECCDVSSIASFAGQSRSCTDPATCRQRELPWVSPAERAAELEARGRGPYVTPAFDRLKGHAWPL